MPNKKTIQEILGVAIQYRREHGDIYWPFTAWIIARNCPRGLTPHQTVEYMAARLIDWQL